MSEKMTVKQFFAAYPSDDACLDHILEVRFGQRHVCHACGVDATFHRITGRRAYACAQCGDHLYPCAETIFRDSRTSLQSWFYAMYLFVVTRHGVSGKELQRALGVTYKTAYRMGIEIRKLMEKANGFSMMQGHIELDEAYVGGRRSGGKRGRGAPGKTIVFGMKERGGRIAAEVIPDIKKQTLRSVTIQNVKPGSTVSTDELMSYGLLSPDGYRHGQVKHGEKDYSHYDYRLGETVHVNNVESFWRLFKKSVASTHIHVSAKHMQKYLNEFVFRSNHRQMQNAMFDLMVAAL